MKVLGRPRKIDRPVEWKVYVPSSVANVVDLLMLDPVTGNIRKGARSALVEELLRRWVEERKIHQPIEEEYHGN